MKMQRDRLSQAIFLGLATSATALNAQVAEEPRERSREIESITVTATKTEEIDQQTAPLSIQAVDENALDEMNIGNFDDLRNNVPGLNAASRGPGQQTIFIRGMAVQPISVLLSGAQGTQPNVALYLDEQPATAPGRNLDIYATDLQRIEVLPGPQGTLFGASSQAGTIRYITNKPALDGFDAGFTGTGSYTDGGEFNSSGEGFINVALGRDTAVRLAFYNINDGGYIDNVFGEFTLDPSVNPEAQVGALPDNAEFETINNIELAEDNFNESFYRGIRFGIYHEFNPDWNFLVQNTYQELGADGVFDFDPEVGDLEVNRFFPDRLRDEFNQISWTLNGRLGMLDTVYTGSYLNRQVDQKVDYTGYNNSGAFIEYYTCSYTNDTAVLYDLSTEFTTDVRQCLDPTKGVDIDQRHNRHTHEIRISTPAENRWRLVGGFFYDDVTIETQDDFLYQATPDLGFAPNAPIETARSINPDTRPPGVAFFNDITRSEEQYAFFGEFSYQLIPDTLTATFGARAYNIESDFEGSSNFANGIFSGSIDSVVAGPGGRDFDITGGHTPDPLEQDDIITKLNLSWTPNSQTLLFATRSEGFRPGGWNRGGGIPSANPEFPTVSATYETDEVTNWELGWKTMLFNNTLRFNGSAYFIEWEDMQVSRFDPQNVSILTFIENSADSEIFGIEADFAWRATQNFTLSGAFSYNDTELTSVDAQVIELAPVGSELPLVPEFQVHLRGRYEKFVNWGPVERVHAQVSGLAATHSFSSLAAEDRERQAGYAIFNAAAGVAHANWSAELFIENLFDKRAELFINNQDDIRRITTNRPLTAGLKFTYRFMPRF